MSAPQRLMLLRDIAVGRQREHGSELNEFSLSLDSGEAVVLLGESGSGKSALMRLLCGDGSLGETVAGTVQFGHASPEPAATLLLGCDRIAYWPDASMPLLSPHAPALAQFVRIVSHKTRTSLETARAEFALALERFSGAPPLATFALSPAAIGTGLLAWGLLAAALAQSPEILVADQPLAQLSPAAARALIDAVMAEQKRLGFGLLYAATRPDIAKWLGARVVVLKQGRVVEEGSVARLAGEQSHAYTRTFFRPTTRDGAQPRGQGRGEPVLQVYGLELKRKGDKQKREPLTFALHRSATLALIGDDGSGRRALVRTLAGLQRPQAGRIVFDSVDIGILTQTMLSRLRRRLAMITGDDAVLDPRLTVADTVEEPLRAPLNLSRELLAAYRDTALKRVGLSSLPVDRAVKHLSSFDNRRLQIARAIAAAPLLVIADEPWRGLEAPAQNAIQDLLRDFRSQEGPAFLTVTADFAVAQALADEALVLENGRVVERGAIADLLRAPQEEATRRLVRAALPERLGG
ncbi:MAG TPA: ATP-binding cassette domain-containing protein [Rhizomicrobium sp.]|jgi:peptide/nickel transport system ATP-binding protein